MKVVNSFEDKNGNELVKFPAAVTNAVNEITISNADSAGAPSIAATGDATNINLNLITKGSGVLQVNGVALSTGTGGDPVIVKTQEFTATTNQTIFTLTNGTYVTAKGMIEVYVSGILQPPSSYTETSSTVVTFSSGITVGTPVFFKWFESASVAIINGTVGTDLITLTAVAVIPSAPLAEQVSLFAKKRAGRILPNFIGPSGIDSALQPALFGNQVYMWTPSNSTTVSIAFGTTWTARNTTGAQSTPTKSTAGFINQMARALFNSTTAANTASGIQSSQTVCVRGNAANIGGFYAFFRFGVETLVATGQQLFVGLTAGLNGVLAGEPSALLNSIAMTKDSGETVWQILTRDGSGTVTKYSTGETVTAGRVYDLYIFCKPNDTKVTIRLVRLNDAVVIIDDVEFSTTLPVATTFMYAEAHLRSTGTAINALALNRIYIECDV